MNDVNQDSEPVELRDCGQASKETRGSIYYWIFELGFPPFDRTPFFGG